MQLTEPKPDKDKIWQPIRKTYKIQEALGEGAFGEVVSAKHRTTGDVVAIKMIKNIQKDSYHIRKIVRELIILRKLSEIKDNVFTSKLLDIILPEGVIYHISEKDKDTGKTISVEAQDLNKLTHIFLVMEKDEYDLKKMLEMSPDLDIDEDHVIILLYNQLCALNYIHSANLVHRDIKPGNILVDSNCNVRICDFGLSRNIPKRSEVEEELRTFHKSKNFYTSQLLEKVSFKKEMSQLLIKHQDDRSKKIRDLTPSVQTRWYRAPEVILTQHQYFESADIWSLGVVLAECMLTCNKYKQPIKGARFLFRGRSCYPISPANDKRDCEVQEDDQIFKILERYKNINPETDFSYISSVDAVDYLTSVKQRVSKNGKLADKFPNSNPELVTILNQMLEFNPYFRPSAKQLLKSTIFDKIRQKNNEQGAPNKVKINIDRSEDAQDYNDPNESKQQTTRFLSLIVKEYQSYNKE